MSNLQKQRLNLLATLDAAKTRSERNKLGQFATPPHVAREIVNYALNRVQKQDIRYLEPGFGTGAFFDSLLQRVDQVDVDSQQRLTEARGYEVDQHYAEPIKELYASTLLNLRLEDFTEAKPEPFDILLCNPPYVRHHHMTAAKKVSLSEHVATRYQMKPSGLTGLYNYFMMNGEAWLSREGIAAFLVPSEFLDVNYGVTVKSFLLKNVCLSHIHLYESSDVQFADALVSSAVVWYRKGKPTVDSTVELSYGGSLATPAHSRTVLLSTLDPAAKWTRLIRKGAAAVPNPVSNKERFTLKDFFEVKRGLATGDNSFFVLSEQQADEHGIPRTSLTPVLPSPRYLKGNVIESDTQGVPVNTDRLFLLNCRQTPETLAADHPATWKYLQQGIGTVSEKYLCNSRKLWYLQEIREPAPVLCTYMGRGIKGSNQPFRFVLNQSKAVATNSYLMLYPKPFWCQQAAHDPALMREVWEILSEITTEDLTTEGRTYGGGLEKIEPSELGKVPVKRLAELLNYNVVPLFSAVL